MPFTKFTYFIYPRIYKVTDVIEVVDYQNNNEADNIPVNWGFFLDD